MLQSYSSVDKITPLLSKIAAPLRMALATNDNDLFSDTLEITQMVYKHIYT